MTIVEMIDILRRGATTIAVVTVIATAAAAAAVVETGNVTITFHLIIIAAPQIICTFVAGMEAGTTDVTTTGATVPVKTVEDTKKS